MEFYLAIGVLGLVLTAVVFPLILACFFTTDQNSVRFVLRFGKLRKIARAGLGTKVCLIDKATKPFSLQLEQESFSETVLDKNDVPVHITCSVMFRPNPQDDKLASAYFLLSNPRAQIKAHVSNALRAKCRQMSFAEILSRRDEIKHYVVQELLQTMDTYGWIIDDALIPSALPDDSVMKAMSDKVASEQRKETAKNEAEAEYSRQVRKAEAAAEEMRLHGVGVSNQRLALANGAKDAVQALSAVNGIDAHEASRTLMMIQWMDLLRDLANKGQNKVIFTNTHPSAITDLEQGFSRAMMSAGEAAGAHAEGEKHAA